MEQQLLLKLSDCERAHEEVAAERDASVDRMRQQAGALDIANAESQTHREAANGHEHELTGLRDQVVHLKASVDALNSASDAATARASDAEQRLARLSEIEASAAAGTGDAVRLDPVGGHATAIDADISAVEVVTNDSIDVTRLQEQLASTGAELASSRTELLSMRAARCVFGRNAHLAPAPA